MNPASSPEPYQSAEEIWPRQVHTITDRFSMANTFLIDDGGLIVIDPGSELNVRQLDIYLRRYLQRSPSDIDLIVLTHLHPDHTDGVTAMHSICRAPVAASAIVKHLLRPDHSGNILPRLSHLAGQVLPGALHHLDLFPPAYELQVHLVDLWLNDTEALPFHPHWRVLASPGHTPESLCLYHPFTHELLCGDTIITIEGGAPLLRAGAHRSKLEETLRVLRSLRVNYLYPGHGRPILGEHPLSNASVEW